MAGASDRTRRFLQSLSGNNDAFLTKVAGMRVRLVAGKGGPDVEIALATAATLLLRLDEFAPFLEIVAPRDRACPIPLLGAGALADEIALAHAGFTSASRLDSAHGAPDLTVVFSGKTSGLQVSSSGWAIALGHQLDGHGNPITAAVAGALAATEVFKAQLLAAGLPERVSRSWTGAISLWDYSLTARQGRQMNGPTDLTGSCFVGGGGIASAAAYGLGLEQLSGDPVIVDDDTIDLTSLNRHLHSTHQHVGDPKVDRMAELLDAAGARSRPVIARWDSAKTSVGAVDLGVITVDNDEARKAFQFDMPRVILNAGNADSGYFRVTRHGFETRACLACISRAASKASTPEESAAARCGIPFNAVQPYLSGSEPIPENVLAMGRLTEDQLSRLRSIPGIEFGREVCGDVTLGVEQPAVSAPMLSALPGLFLAAEVVKEAQRRFAPLNESFNGVGANFLKGPHRRWLTTMEKLSTCKCGDPLFQAHFKQKWSG